MTCSRRSKGFRAIAVSVALVCGLAATSGAIADEPPLPEEHFNHLLKVVSEKGTPISLPPDVAQALGFAPGPKSAASQVAMEQGDGLKHGFARMSDGSGFFLFSRAKSGDITVFNVAPDLKLRKAAGSFAGKRMMALPPAEGERQLRSEFEVWEKVLSAKRESPWNDKPYTGTLPEVPKRKLPAGAAK